MATRRLTVPAIRALRRKSLNSTAQSRILQNRLVPPTSTAVRTFSALPKPNSALPDKEASPIGAESGGKGTPESEGKQKQKGPRVAILDAALGKVQEHGWTQAALAAGAVECGYSTVTAGILPRGAVDLVDHFMATALEETREKMASEEATEGNLGPADIGDSSGVSEERIARAMEIRLMCLAPYIKTWPQAMGLGLLPTNIPTTAQAIATLADELAFLGGDRSTDAAWYSRRAGLAAAYVSAELFMLTDTSPGFADTRGFARRAITDLAHVSKAPSSAQDLFFGARTAMTALASAGAALLSPALKQAPGAATAAELAPAAAAAFQAVLSFLASRMPSGPSPPGAAAAASADGSPAAAKTFAAAPEVDPWLGDKAFEAHLKEQEKAFAAPAAPSETNKAGAPVEAPRSVPPPIPTTS